MKIKILGPVLLLTLATRFAQAAEGDIAVETNNNSNNNNNIKDILDANFAAAPAAPATEQVVAVALDSQKAGDALEVAVDMVEAAAKVFADEEVEEDGEDDEEGLTDADEGEDDEDEYEYEDEGEEETAAKDEHNQDEAFSVEGDDFHYADPLTVKYDAQTAQCKQAQSQQHQEQQQQQPQEQQRPPEEPQGQNQQQQTAFQKRDTTQQPLLLPLHEALLHAEATAEVGGACIDSFVNFALRFRERCSIKCLKTFSHVFSNPNVLGILDCFGCSNFFVSGFYALGVDCAGIFAAYPKPANATTGKPVTTMTTTTTMKTTMTTMATPGATNKAGVPPSQSGSSPKSTNDDSSDTTPAGDYRLGPVKPEDAALPPLDFANMLKSLGQLTSGDLQGWLDIGSDLAKVVGSGAGGASKGQSGKSEVGEGEDSSSKEEDEAKAAASKDLFNKFVGKAASFADWHLTPETLDQTGVFDRVQSLGLV
ncbi:hypothetical protein BGX24_008656 [Mortierella sp. AD032]|nr:hypothetical protein BGX24_008656 [Mortierella sp. AD032]